MPSSYIDLSPLRFLVADDSQFMRRLVLCALKAFGVRFVVEASKGEEAYALIQAGQFDICILDWEFPDRTGESVMRALRRPDNPSAYQTVIMMSGYGEKRRIERALRFGVDGYVAKPVAPSTLYTQIRQCVLYPRRYIRTDTYLGPHHPVMMNGVSRPNVSDTKPNGENTSPALDFFEIDDMAAVE